MTHTTYESQLSRVPKIGLVSPTNLTRGLAVKWDEQASIKILLQNSKAFDVLMNVSFGRAWKSLQMKKLILNRHYLHTNTKYQVYYTKCTLYNVLAQEFASFVQSCFQALKLRISSWDAKVAGLSSFKTFRIKNLRVPNFRVQNFIILEEAQLEGLNLRIMFNGRHRIPFS